MQSSSPRVHTESRLDPGLFQIAEKTLHDARAHGASRLLGFGVALGSVDPLAVLEETAAAGQARFFWEHPRAGFALAAGGVAKCLRAAGRNRFEDISHQITRIFGEEIGTGGGDDQQTGKLDAGPFAIGGFSFFDGMEGEEWAGFQPAEFIIPEWSVVRKDGVSRGWVSIEVTPETDLEALKAHADQVVKRLEAAAGATPPEAAPGNGNSIATQADFAPAQEGRDHWIDAVRSASSRIRTGELDKVVLARVMDLQCALPPSPYGMLATLRASYPNCYAFLFDPGNGKAFLGASPERMARFDPGRIGLAALAGTVPRSKDPQADAAHADYLLDTHKEREEHRMVVEDILEAMGGLGRIECPDLPQVIKLNNLQHLFTPITLFPDSPQHPIGLLGRLHPTAAVGGHPRETASRLIAEYERFERGWYGAPIGWLNANGQGEFAVALRSGLLEGTRLRLFAGGGIMADSEPEREFEETLIKFQPLLSALNGYW